MGRIAVSSVARSPRWRTSDGKLQRLLNLASRPKSSFLIFLALLVILSLLILDSTFPWHAFVPLGGLLATASGLPILPPGCDLFTGSWVYDESYPLYTNCSFAEQGFRCAENGRADLQYRNWRWQPRDCDMPRYSSPSFVKARLDQASRFLNVALRL